MIKFCIIKKRNRKTFIVDDVDVNEFTSKFKTNKKAKIIEFSKDFIEIKKFISKFKAK